MLSRSLRCLKQTYLANPDFLCPTNKGHLRLTPLMCAELPMKHQSTESVALQLQGLGQSQVGVKENFESNF